jgi:hypothetical protein
MAMLDPRPWQQPRAAAINNPIDRLVKWLMRRHSISVSELLEIHRLAAAHSTRLDLAHGRGGGLDSGARQG